VIDDEEYIRQMLADMLSEHFLDVTPSGDHGLRLFSQNRHDIVFTDIGMPGLSGWSIAYTIRQIGPTTAIIAVTGWGDHIPLEQHQASAIDIILPKPFTLDDLHDALRRAVYLHQQRLSDAANPPPSSPSEPLLAQDQP
jgi:FixJ family two-component response regulator